MGTGLSHDGSSCLLKDGELIVAIEKERISRKKHDGQNDFLSVRYCLEAAGITLEDVSLVVQAANFEKDEIMKHSYQGARFFPQNCTIPFVSISHHLAHAYSAIGTCPFDEFNLLVVDGCGSFYFQCDDLAGTSVPADVQLVNLLEKDSFYHYEGGLLTPIFKDFSAFGGANSTEHNNTPTTKHSIGGVYSVFSNYIFCNLDDVGKLMGLAPFGDRTKYNDEIFDLREGRVFVKDEALKVLSQPSSGYEDFKARFSYFADLAAWVQKEVERAVLYVVNHRQSLASSTRLCYAGGVALNAVANARILRETSVQELYMEPAAADNGLAIGCAYYGWLEVLKGARKLHSGSTYLGRTYTENEIVAALDEVIATHPELKNKCTKETDIAQKTAQLLSEGKVIGWYQRGAEFGPRALGNRSILADGRIKGVRAFVNRDVKMREDFRPFAPSVIAEDVHEYFEYGYDSPYMILVDKIRDRYKEEYGEVVHVDGSARVQTVTQSSNPLFYNLLNHFKQLTGSSILLNTSFNKKGMPIVETPTEALALFYTSKLDAVVIGDWLLVK